MRRSTKALLLLEVLLCFGPMTLLLAVGLTLLPLQIVLLIADPMSWHGALPIAGYVGCGLAGLTALGYVLGDLMLIKGSVRRPWLVFAGAALGVSSLVPILLSGHPVFALLAAMPIASAVHILILFGRETH